MATCVSNIVELRSLMAEGGVCRTDAEGKTLLYMPDGQQLSVEFPPVGKYMSQTILACLGTIQHRRESVSALAEGQHCAGDDAVT